MSKLLRLIADDSELVLALRELGPDVFGALVSQVGLEDSGELLALATPAQLQALADDDLWHVAEGHSAERLDAGRFGVWLEVLLESGTKALGSALAAMDEDMLAHALSGHLYAFDLDALAPVLASDESLGALGERELIDKLLDATLTHEMHHYLLVSRSSNGWDALIEGLYALDIRSPAKLQRLLQRLSEASLDMARDEGLHEVLSSAEELADAALGDHELRREERGYVSPPDAKAFLTLASERPEEVGEDPISLRYQRRFLPAVATEGGTRDGGGSRLAALLAEHGLTRRDGPTMQLGARESRLRTQMRRLSREVPALHTRRMLELGFLVNVLRSSEHGRTLGLVELVDQVFLMAETGDDTGQGIESSSLLTLFARGWSLRGANSS